MLTEKGRPKGKSIFIVLIVSINLDVMDQANNITNWLLEKTKVFINRFHGGYLHKHLSKPFAYRKINCNRLNFSPSMRFQNIPPSVLGNLRNGLTEYQMMITANLDRLKCVEIKN